MNEYILITGGSRGIGSAIAIKFAKAGYNIIIISSKDEKGLIRTAETIRSCNVDCHTYICDVSDWKSVEKLGKKLHSLSIEPDCVINNAGISYFGLFQCMSAEDWNKIIAVNLSSVFYISKVFSENMLKKHKGCIINISSVWGNTGASCEVAYSASKGGINAFTKALAKELSPSHIRVNAIACGAIDTDMNSRLNAEERIELESAIPLGRMGTSEEVAQLAYMIYSMNEYMTGQIITLDGGWT